MIPISDEQAKALTASAEAAKAGIELTDKTGTFITGTFAESFKILSGMTALELRLLAEKHWLSVQDRFTEILRRRAIQGKPNYLKPKFLVDVMQAASLEDDETLQGLWANLIANAMDPAYSESVHPAFIDVIKSLSPDEALILQHLAQLDSFPSSCIPGLGERECTQQELYDGYLRDVPLKNRKSTATYLDNLERLAIIKLSLVQNAIGDRQVLITEFGESFIDVTLGLPRQSKSRPPDRAFTVLSGVVTPSV